MTFIKENKNIRYIIITIIIVLLTISLLLISRMREMFQNSQTPRQTNNANNVNTLDLSRMVRSIENTIEFKQKQNEYQKKQDNRLLLLEKRIKRLF